MCFRVSDSLGPVPFFNPSRARTAGRARGHRASVSPPNGSVRAFEFIGDPGLVDSTRAGARRALRFVELGFFHILDGTDHLLFLFCLVDPFRRFARSFPW